MTGSISVDFCIWDFDDIIPDEITHTVMITPRKTYAKGKVKSERNSSLAKENGWLLGSGVSVSATFEEHMDALLLLIEPKLEQFKMLANKYYTEISVEIIVPKKGSTPPIHLERRHIELLNVLGTEVDFDIYR